MERQISELGKFVDKEVGQVRNEGNCFGKLDCQFLPRLKIQFGKHT